MMEVLITQRYRENSPNNNKIIIIHSTIIITIMEIDITIKRAMQVMLVNT